MPTSTDELLAAVAAAADRGERVKALGSRHSFSTVADTDGVHVSTRALVAEPTLETLDDGREVVAVTSATTYAELGEWLHRHGRALANLASLPHISVAGACATGTHGSGDGNGSLATAVRGVELATAAGELVRIGADDPDLPGAAVSLGRLGVVTRLWFEVEPTYEIAQRVWADVPSDELRVQVDAVLASAYSVSVFTDFAGATPTSAVWVKERLDRASALAPLLADRPSATTPQHPVPGIDPAPATTQLGRPGPWHERLPHFRAEHVPSVGEEVQSEYFVPRDAVADVVGALAEVGPLIEPALMVHELRAVAADDLWLSPARGRAVAGVHFTWVRDPAAVEAAVAVVEAALRPWAPMAHWGKVASADVPRCSPAGLEELEVLRRRLDPGGVFSS